MSKGDKDFQQRVDAKLVELALRGPAYIGGWELSLEVIPLLAVGLITGVIREREDLPSHYEITA